ncbi:glycosyltransferase [Halorussus sp. MSC15.2]|uniref:glycosyltransferase family 2 protein n=1 Tax=Halorussus sp. MSC15.2 TaxID=2283638 RepID=UPI0013D7B77B|nr:glycosyltransferase [Halorussus sp. MSC15.2]NEU55649.1 glycosyltransferase [Halorussus sp. MSC15.2]
MPSPEVSIILPTLNEEEFIEEAIDSLLAQTFEDFEVLIIDGGSSDGTIGKINEYSDERIDLFIKQGLGFSSSLNFAIDRAKGKYIARVDSDDFSMEDRIEKQVDFLNKNPDVGVVGVGNKSIDTIREEEYDRYYPTEDLQIRKEMAKGIPLIHSGVMARREILITSGLYDGTINDIEDLELWTRVGQHTKFANINEILVERKIRPDSTWHSKYGLWRRNLTLIWFNIKAVRSFSLPTRYYVFPLLRLFYILLPPAIKKQVRKVFSRFREDY